MGMKMELDVYLPTERLAFEYQGEQHYCDIYSLGNLWIQQQKDKEKKAACEMQGIILLEIPFWWDFKKSSLVATLHARIPKLVHFQENAEPIPSQPPNGYPNSLFYNFLSFDLLKVPWQISCTEKNGTESRISRDGRHL